MKNLDIYHESKIIGINLSRNENFLKRDIPNFRCSFNDYPSTTRLKNAIADFHGVAPWRVVVGAGATGVLMTCVNFLSHISNRCFLSSGSYLPIAKMLLQNKIDRNFVYSKEFPAIFVNPNNPTGDIRKFSKFDLENKFCTVIDESYMDFYDSSMSALELVDDLDNLIVIRTFSKLHGLASIRVGYAICSSEISKEIRKFEAMYQISDLSISIAEYSLQSPIEKYYREDFKERNKESINFLFSELSSMGIDMKNPCANFISARIPDVPGFTTRDLSPYEGMEGWKRITTSDMETMKKFIGELEKIS